MEGGCRNPEEISFVQTTEGKPENGFLE